MPEGDLAQGWPCLGVTLPGLGGCWVARPAGDGVGGVCVTVLGGVTLLGGGIARGGHIGGDIARSGIAMG